MHVLIAPDKFKGCLSADGVAQAIAAGVLQADQTATVDQCPLADGGEGTLDALLGRAGGHRFSAAVCGPLGLPVTANWAVLPDGTVVVESAAAAGLALIPEQRRNPLLTTTFGVGELLLRALDHGAKRIIVALGGTGTTDAGAGCLQALGARFAQTRTPIAGGELVTLDSADFSGLDSRLRDVELITAYDVRSPLYGEDGAAYVFAPQKGASPDAVAKLDCGLRKFSKIAKSEGFDHDPNAAGMGAAGGLAFGLAAFCGARLVSGADFVLDYVGFAERAGRADLVLTAEGRVDQQSLQGKAVVAVAREARLHGTCTVALTGSEAIELERLWGTGIAAAFSICDGPMTLSEAEARAAPLLTRRTAQIVKLWLEGRHARKARE